jgi:hypothetical protein
MLMNNRLPGKGFDTSIFVAPHFLVAMMMMLRLS